MTKGLLAVLVAAGLGVGAFLLLRDDDGTSAPTTTTTTTATTTTVATVPLEVYFYRGAALVPVVVRVPATEAVANAAVRALLEGPPAGLTTTIPADTRLAEPVTIAEAVAT